MSLRSGLLPPAFRAEGDPYEIATGLLRRVAAGTLLMGVLWLGVFAPLGTLGSAGEFDPDAITTPQLFILHIVLLATLAVWYLLGFGVGRGASWTRQLGLQTASAGKEIVIGLVAGIAAWVSVIAVMILVGLALWAVGRQELLPEAAPPLVPWLAGLPVFLRLGLSLSAGVAEEAFFRGFLQPRTGILFSSSLFVLAHLSYEQPFMLLGVLLLSLIFALLVRWRQSIWAAAAAHATFDAMQLLVMIPWALDHLEGAELAVDLSLALSRGI